MYQPKENNNQVIHKRICFFLSWLFPLFFFLFFAWITSFCPDVKRFFLSSKKTQLFFSGPTLCTWIIRKHIHTQIQCKQIRFSEHCALCKLPVHSDCDPFCIHFHLSMGDGSRESERVKKSEREHVYKRSLPMICLALSLPFIPVKLLEKPFFPRRSLLPCAPSVEQKPQYIPVCRYRIQSINKCVSMWMITISYEPGPLVLIMWCVSVCVCICILFT